MSDQSISGSETDQYRTSDPPTLQDAVYAARRVGEELSYKYKYPHAHGAEHYMEHQLRKDVLTICRHFNIGEVVVEGTMIPWKNVEPKKSVSEEPKLPLWTLGPDESLIEAQRWLERAAQTVDRKIARELDYNRRVRLRPDRLPPWLSSLKKSIFRASQAISNRRSEQEYAQNETRTLDVLRKAREIVDGYIGRHPDAEPQDVLHTVQAGTLIIEPGHTYEFTVGAGEVYLCTGRMRNGRVALEVSDAPQSALPGPLTYEEYQSNSNPRVLITFKTDEDALKWVASLAQVIATKK